MKRGGVALAVASLALWVATAAPTVASAQPSSDLPTLPATLHRLPDGAWAVSLAVPDGWSLYTHEPGRLGLPLELSWRLDGRRMDVEARWPEGVPYETPTGVARVWREPVTGVLTAGVAADDAARGSEGTRLLAVEVRWALCREDLCVPGRTEAEYRLR